jgi:hypothetical protein
MATLKTDVWFGLTKDLVTGSFFFFHGMFNWK